MLPCDFCALGLGVDGKLNGSCWEIVGKLLGSWGLWVSGSEARGSGSSCGSGGGGGSFRGVCSGVFALVRPIYWLVRI